MINHIIYLGYPRHLQVIIRELKQQPRRRLQKRHLKSEFAQTSNSIALIPTRSIREMLAHFSGVEFLKAVSNFMKRKRKSLSCVHVLDKA